MFQVANEQQLQDFKCYHVEGELAKKGKTGLILATYCVECPCPQAVPIFEKFNTLFSIKTFKTTCSLGEGWWCEAFQVP